MAFLDFLGQGVGGMQQAQGPNMTGDAGVGSPQPIGPTYGDALQMGLQYGSKPGSSGPAIASTIPNSGWQQRVMQPLASTAPPQAKQAMGQSTPQADDALTQIAKWFTSLIASGSAPTGTGAP